MRCIHPATAQSFFVVMLIAFAVALLWATVAYAAPRTSDDLKVLFGEPWPLLGVMYVGAFISAAKTVGSARRSGAHVTLAEYFGYVPETLSAVGAVFFAWLGLLYTDQLNFAAAAAWGAAANTGADLIRAKGRTGSLTPDAPNDSKRPPASGG